MTQRNSPHRISVLVRRRQAQLARNARGSHETTIYPSLTGATVRKLKLAMAQRDPYIKFFVSGISVPMLVHPTKGKRRVTEYERQER